MALKYLLIAAIFGYAISFHAQSREIEGIVAIVDEDVVLASELLARLGDVKTQMEMAKIEPPPEDVLMSQLVERLVMESLQLQMGDRAGVRIDDETLTRSITGIAQQNQMSLDAFRERLAADGMDYNEFRESIRREIVINRVQRSQVGRRVFISDQEIEEMLKSPVGQQAFSDEYRVGHILLALEDRPNDEVIALAQEEANTIYTDLVAGANFRQTAIAKSAGSNALEGGDMGWRKAGEMPSLYGEQVIGLKVGETLEPIRSASGFHIVQLLEIRGAGAQTAEQVNVRHILLRNSEIQSEEQTQELIQNIYQRIVDGEEFGAMAREFSNDPSNALMGGEMGWNEPASMVGEFAEVMRTQPIGEVSKPFKTSFGWHIAEILERRTQDMSEKARKNMATQVLHNRRFDEELQVWLKEIRDEAYVELRL
jgi:peptidyl-prolyl cis-trans isomerase SurA